MVYTKLEKTDFEVLNFLISNLHNEYSIKEIAEKIKKPYVKVHKSIKRLSEKKIIKEALKGKSHYCSIIYKENLDIVCFVNAQKARNFLEKNKKIGLLISDIQEGVSFPDYSLVLFGSYAKGKADKYSDLDIAIITSIENKEKAESIINSIKRTTPLNLHPLVFTYKEFIDMLSSKENNVGKEIIKNNIIFKGCEQLYECVGLIE